MTCVVVNDASCLIDLRKGGLLGVLCALPCQVVVPLPIRASELLDFSDRDWQILDDAGMTTYDLIPEQVQEAIALKHRHPALSANDCFCVVTARLHNGILLTGDSLRRRVASRVGLRVHGVLWVIDQLKAVDACDNARLIHALEVWRDDDAVFLPNDEISKRIRHLDPAKGLS